MSKLKFENIPVEVRAQKLFDLKIYLKTEFIGIDDQIEQIVDYFKPFYLYPEAIRRPIVVFLAGCTGIGKTEVINKLVEFLDLRDLYSKFDVGNYTTNSYDLGKDIIEIYDRDEVSDSHGKHLSGIMLIDEFQIGRTIDEEENETKESGIRSLWKLVDDGIINDSSSGFYELYQLDKMFRFAQHMNDEGFEIVDGAVPSNKWENFCGKYEYYFGYRPSDDGNDERPRFPNAAKNKSTGKKTKTTQGYISFLGNNFINHVRKIKPDVFQGKTYDEIREKDLQFNSWDDLSKFIRRIQRSSYKERMMNALAPRGDEGRVKLR